MIDVKGYEGRYKIDDKGNVYSVGRKRFLKPDTSGDGYARYTLSTNGKTKKWFAHRLMLLSYGIEQTGEVVNHKDGDKLNNTLNNLEWCSVSYNNSHAYMTGLKSQNGEQNHRSKLKTKDVIEIRAMNLEGINLNTIANKYNTTRSKIYRIVTRRRWKQIE